MKLPLIVFAILLAIIIISKWYSKRPEKPKETPEKTGVKTEKKKTGWGWIICVIALIFGGYYGYKHYLKSPITKEAAVAQEKWQLSWEKKPEYAGKTGVRHTSLPAAIENRDKEKIIISYVFSSNVGIMKGFSRDSGKSFDGIWKDATGWGCWHLRFTSDNTAFGWSDDGGKGYKQPNVLEKIS